MPRKRPTSPEAAAPGAGEGSGDPGVLGVRGSDAALTGVVAGSAAALSDAWRVATWALRVGGGGVAMRGEGAR